jgi:acetylornithine deacetylase/succinyl-diaminopimelate desuccinylase-like protein
MHDLYDVLRAKTEGLKNSAILCAQKLVQARSLSYQEADVASLVEREMRNVGLEQVTRDGFGNVVGVVHGRETDPVVLLNCHLDSAHPGDEGAWTTPVTSGHIDGGRLHGLGAGDCKGGMAAIIYAAALLKRCMLPLRGTLVVAGTVAEEDGGSVGIRHLLGYTLPKLDLKPSYAILGEPTGLGLYYGHDGWAEFEIAVEGDDAAHVENAAWGIFKDIDAFHRCAERPEAPLAARAEPPVFHQENGSRRATIALNRRMSSSEEASDIVAQMKHHAVRAMQAAGAEEVEVQVVVKEECQRLYTGRTTVVRRVTHAWSTDPFDPVLDKARGALAGAGLACRPGKWRLGRLGMGTAGGVLVNEYHIPTLGYGPGNEDVIHAPNEYVEVDKIVQAVYGTAAIVHSLAGVPVFAWTADEV